MDSFVKEKGNFEAYCKVIFKHKILNLIKASKNRFMLIIIDVDEMLPEDDQDLLEEKENHQRALDFIGKLESMLDDEEKKFLSAMYDVCVKSDNKLISETSRNLEISNSKGWDIFRRIQRKAKRLCDQRIAEKIDSLVLYNRKYKAIDFQIDNEQKYSNRIFYISTYDKKEISEFNYINLKDSSLFFSEDQLKKLSELYKLQDNLPGNFHDSKKKKIPALKKFINKIKKFFQ